jgi:putative transposase
MALRLKLAEAAMELQMARVFLPDLSVHVIRRGINRMPIFGDDSDREFVLAMMEHASTHEGVDIHAYVLMSTHYHLIATPSVKDALPHAMRDIGREYVRRYNRKYNRIGTLWTGRYRAIPITNERYWLTCLRYIEQNPVRAQMVSSPSDYKWSSFSFHGLGHPQGWLKPHPVYMALGPTAEDRQSAYRALCGIPLDESELVRQRNGLFARAERASSTPPAEPESP